MEKKQGFFSALKEEVVRGLSPSRSRANSPARTASPMSGLLRRKKHSSCSSSNNYNYNYYVAQPELLIARSGSLRPVGETLAPLMEGPDPDGGEIGDSKRSGSGLGQWVKGQLSRTPSVTAMACKRSDLRLLLGVMGAPLAPIHVSSTDPLPHLSIKDTPIVSSSSIPFSFLCRSVYFHILYVCAGSFLFVVFFFTAKLFASSVFHYSWWYYHQFRVKKKLG